MAGVNPRNSPKSPFSGLPGPEIPRSPFRGEEFGETTPGGAMTADLFGLEQPPPRNLDRIRAAGGVAFMARDCHDVLRELQGNQWGPSQ